METIRFGERVIAGFGLGDGAIAKPVDPRRSAAIGAFLGGVGGMFVGFFVGNLVYDAEGRYGPARTGVNATGPILAGAATAVLGATVGAWALTTSTPVPR